MPSLIEQYVAAQEQPAAAKPTRELTNIYDEQGQPLPVEDVSSALSDGRARFDADQSYSVLTPSGEARQVTGDQVYNALGQGWTLESREEADLRQRRAAAGLGDKAAAAGLGVVESLTFGVAPGVAEIIGGDQAARDWRRATEVAPGAHTVGEVLGLVSPLGVEALAARGLTKGATGAALMGATAAPRALSRYSRAAGDALAGKLPEATTALGRALRQGVKFGTEGALEGAVYGTGYAVGEASLGDKELKAEQLLAAAGGGALLGAGIGVGLGVAGSGIASATKGFDLSGFAERQAWKATGATGANTRQVGLDQAKRSGRRMLDEGLLKFESFEERAQALRKATNEAGEEIGKLIESIDGTGARPSVAPIVEKLDEQLGKLRDGVGADVRLAKKIDRDFGDWLRDRLDEAPTFKELHGMRARVDDYLEKARRSNDTVVQSELGKLRSNIEDEIKRQADAIAPQVGDDFLGQYTAAKSRYRDLVSAAKIAEYRAPMLEAGNRSISLTDTIAAAGGLASAGPGGLIMGGVNKALREYGDTAAALLANKLGGKRAAQPLTLAQVMGAAPGPANQQTAPSLHQRLLDGTLPESEWSFLRGGYRDMTRGLDLAYSGPANPTDIATGRAIPVGGRRPLEPIQLIVDQGEVHLRDGRHRLKAAQKYGATHILATIQDASEYHTKGPFDLDPVVIPLPGTGQPGPSPAATQAKLAALGYVKSKADKVALQLSSGVEGAVTKRAHSVVPKAPSGAATYEALAADAREHRVAPDRSATKIAARVAPLVETTPELARAVTVKATGDLDYLAAQLPSAATSGAILEQAKKITPSGSERAAFERKARAVLEPQSAVFDMKNGKLSDDAVAAIRERRPLLLTKIQEEAERAYADLVAKGKLPDRQDRLQLEKLLDRKIDPASNPTVIRIVQRSYATQAKMQAPPPISPSKLSRADRMLSQSEEIARGDF